MTQVLPFRLVGTEDVGVLRSALGGPMQSWAADWFSSSPNLVFQVSESVSPSLAASSGWTLMGEQSGVWLAWSLPEILRREFTEKLLGAPVPPGGDVSLMVQALVGECLLDLGSKLFAMAETTPATGVQNGITLAPSMIGYGSGAACVGSEAGCPLPDLVFGGEFVERLLARPRKSNAKAAALVHRHAAIRQRRANVEVVLGDAELTLADLANVSVGDVIRLQSRYRDPLLVRSPKGEPLMKANLGSAGACKAIQVIGKAS